MQFSWAEPSILSLQDALTLVQGQNLKVLAQAPVRRLSALQIDNAQASLWPTLSLTSDLSRPGPNLGGDPMLNAASRSQYETSWRTNLAFKWVVFNGFGNWENLELAKVSASTTQARSEVELLQIRSQVASTYWEVARNQELHKLRLLNLERSSELLRIAQAKRAIGAGTLLESRQAELDRNADQSAELKQRLSVRQSQRNLNALLNRDLETEFQVDSLAPMDTSLSKDALLASMQQNHPILKAAQLSEKASETGIRVAGSDWYPEVSVYANYNLLEQFNDQNPPPDLHRQGMLWGAQLTVPLFEGGSTRTKLASAKESRELARMTTQMIRADLDQSLAVSWANFQQSVELWRIEINNASLADSTFQMAVEQFRLGALSATEMRRFQESSAEAATRSAMARFDAKQTEITVLSLAGML
jgi:outer membrane protein TolC